jgi:hypothetical protein
MNNEWDIPVPRSVAELLARIERLQHELRVAEARIQRLEAALYAPVYEVTE